MDELTVLYNKRYDGRLNKSTLSRYEHGLQQPMFSVVKNLADLFGVTSDYMTNEEKPTTDTDDGLSLEGLTPDALRIAEKASRLSERSKRELENYIDFLATKGSQ